MYYHYLIRLGNEYLPFKGAAVYRVFRGAYRRFKIEGTEAEIGSIVLPVNNIHIAKRHIVPLVHGSAAESVKYYLFRFGDLFFKEQLSYSSEIGKSRFVITLSESAGPNRILVKLNTLAEGLREDHAADPPVAYRQSLVPVVGRSFIIKKL